MNAPSTAYKPPAVNPLLNRARRILTNSASFEDRFAANMDELVVLVENLRMMGCKIAFTMGSWDFFHLGHSDYIKKGKEEACKVYPNEQVIMIVGVDSDVVVRERKSKKGAPRPFVKEDERLRQIAHLRYVDIVALEHKLREMPQRLPHDVRIISDSTGDAERLAEQGRYCEHLINLPPQLDDSATARLRRLALEGRAEVLEELEAGLTQLLKKVRGNES